MNPIRAQKDILVVKLSAIGDVVLTLPALRVIKQEEPGCRLTFLVGTAAAPLLENIPEVDERLIIDERIFWGRKTAALWTLFRLLRARRFRSVYIFHWSPWFHLYFALMGIPRRFGFAREGRSFGLTRPVSYREGTHAPSDVAQYQSVVSGFLNSEVPMSPPHLIFRDEEIKEMEDRCNRLHFPPDRVWITVAPGGGNNPKLFMPAKRWPAERYRELITLLVREEQAWIILLGDATERDLLDPFENPVNPFVVNLAGSVTLRQTALMIRKSRLFVGNDSGLLHIAGAVGAPSVSFFGPTSPDSKTPAWTPHRILYTQEPCSPCYRYGKAPPCPFHLRCLTGISVIQASQAIHELLREPVLS